MTFIGRYKQAPDYPYAEYTADGNDYIRDENGKTVGLISCLTKIIADDSRPADERSRAAECLQCYSDTVKSVVEYPRPAGTPQVIIDMDNRVAKGFGNTFAAMMWYTPDDCLFRDWPQSDNGDYTRVHPSRSVLSKRYHGKQPEGLEPETPPAPTPAPVSAPFTPAVPYPILAPSTDEQKAVEHTQSQFTPAKVAARVAAVEAAAKKQLSPVEEIEASIAERHDLQRRIEANEKELARLRALRDANELAHELEDFGPVMKPSV